MKIAIVGTGISHSGRPIRPNACGISTSPLVRGHSSSATAASHNCFSRAPMHVGHHS